MKIADAANVMTPAYLAIVAKGFSVRSSGGRMIAERGDDRFIAHSPVPLLGLIAMAEIRGDDWKASNDEIQDFIALFG